MSGKLLVFVPYQDSDNFYSDGILTREYSLLYYFYLNGFHNVLNIKKPRTILDKKKYDINPLYYPKNSIEYNVKNILDRSKTIQSQTIFSFNQLLLKRGWWINSYLSDLDNLKECLSNYSEVLVYSNNPFAYKLLNYLKEKGCKIYFDVMDNFAIHPSLSRIEQNYALKGYRNIFKFADVLSANSLQSCKYMSNQGAGHIHLVKNGVFFNTRFIPTLLDAYPQINQIRKSKEKYKNIVGYVGKLGKRIDANLVEKVVKGCSNSLFVFVGPFLTGQMSKKLEQIIKQEKNIIHLAAIPSAYVFTLLNEFDILMIPHSVGKNENGGDPLKLYQYLTTNLPIITTSILGVDEFKNYIKITDDANVWCDYINNSYKEGNILNRKELPIDWNNRLIKLKSEIF